MRGLGLAAVAVIACGGAPAKPPVTAPVVAAAPGKHVDFGDFTIELPAGVWRPNTRVANLDADASVASGLTAQGGSFAFFDEATGLFVHGYGGLTDAGVADPGGVVDTLHHSAGAHLTADWTVGRRERKDGGQERRHTLAGEDAEGLMMEAMSYSYIAADGAVWGAAVQCVYKIVEPARGATCRAVLASLRRHVAPP